MAFIPRAVRSWTNAAGAVAEVTACLRRIVLIAENGSFVLWNVDAFAFIDDADHGKIGTFWPSARFASPRNVVVRAR